MFRGHLLRAELTHGVVIFSALVRFAFSPSSSPDYGHEEICNEIFKFVSAWDFNVNLKNVFVKVFNSNSLN